MKQCIYKVMTDKGLREVTGYVDHTNHIGYSHRYADGEWFGIWISTDLDTGLAISNGWTKKSCIKRTNYLLSKVLELKSKFANITT